MNVGDDVNWRITGVGIGNDENDDEVFFSFFVVDDDAMTIDKQRLRLLVIVSRMGRNFDGNDGNGDDDDAAALAAAAAAVATLRQMGSRWKCHIINLSIRGSSAQWEDRAVRPCRPLGRRSRNRGAVLSFLLCVRSDRCLSFCVLFCARASMVPT